MHLWYSNISWNPIVNKIKWRWLLWVPICGGSFVHRYLHFITHEIACELAATYFDQSNLIFLSLYFHCQVSYQNKMTMPEPEQTIITKYPDSQIRRNLCQLLPCKKWFDSFLPSSAYIFSLTLVSGTVAIEVTDSPTNTHALFLYIFL